MRKLFAWWVIVLLLLIGTQGKIRDCWASDGPPSVGSVLPEMHFPVPESPAARHYLGVTGSGEFKITQIGADVVIVEVFSMYCPFCQREAPAVNDLYDIIKSRPKLKDKIRMVGVGVGNTSYEVNFFKDHYNIAFPLFPDPNFTVHKALGEVRTPYFLVFKTNKEGSHKIIYSKAGSFGDPQKFLDSILEKAQIKE